MKEAIRCCISCILPCGSLDVIRIVHANGRVEEIGHAVRAGDITQAYPKHVLRKPPSPAASVEGDSKARRRAVVLPPTAELQRGKIYFLMPVSEEKRPAAAREPRRRAEINIGKERTSVSASASAAAAQRERRRGRVGVWRPHLDSISEMIMHEY